ncbi:MAG: DNA translocase FtsK [Chloroflexota bacterium]|nr:DNA translocase FtsK [Chloroflexota bacterium]
MESGSKNRSSGENPGSDLLNRAGSHVWDITGVILLALSLMTIVAILFPGLAGGLLGWWVDVLRIWFGWGSLWVAITLFMIGVWMIRKQRQIDTNIKWGRILALEIAAFASVAILSLLNSRHPQGAEPGPGGRIGWALSELSLLLFDILGVLAPYAAGLLFLILLFAGLLVGLGLFNPTLNLIKKLSGSPAYSSTMTPYSEPAVSEAPLQGSESADLVSNRTVKGKQRKKPLAPEFRKSFRIQPDSDTTKKSAQPRDERLPPLDLLVKEQSSRPNERNINLTAGLIEQTLAEFSIPAKVIDFKVGPTVTQFALEPGYVEKEKSSSEGEIDRQKVRVSQISGLRRDLALALSAERLRIQAPVPGRPYVGIEIPNMKSVIVRLRPILESEAFYKINSPLAISLGRDVSGQPVVADLSMMPHLLVAGATGSGKSVCIAAITTCMVMNNTPDDLKLIIVDPKMVELVRFNGLPHLIGKVETDIERILAVLRWTVAEMDRRYQLLEGSRSRNIDTYNRKARRRKDLEPMPRLVLLIDELADLMMTAPDQTEHNLVRLAQMARATGIHLIVATQRPSTDVVTGLIKANFPARISFSVASSVDSRVILDTVGAEHLLGRGDMLFLPPEAPGPIRLQGVMVSDQEVEHVITFWQKSRVTEEKVEPVPWDVMLEEEKTLGEKDVLIPKAITIVRDTQRASASMLQRRLRVGFPRAARLIDQLEEMGIIGPPQSGGKERAVLISEDDEIPGFPTSI